MKKHTPGPWECFKEGQFLKFQIRSNSIPLAEVEKEVNAKFIVHACNCHDALVEACEKGRVAILGMLDGIGANVEEMPITKEIISVLDQALSKAEPKEVK